MGWMTSQNRKRYQRAVNKVFRELNYALAVDSLWRGRFLVRQTQSRWIHENDYYYLIVEYEMIDLKTGIVKPYIKEANSICSWGGGKVFWEMNDFITQWCDVWRVEGSEALRSDKTVYRSPRK